METILRVRQSNDETSSLFEVTSGNTIQVDGQEFKFDSIQGGQVDQQELFERTVQPFLDSEIIPHSKDVTLFTMGPSGAGKSYTVFGTPSNVGLLYRSLSYLLQQVTGDLASYDTVKKHLGMNLINPTKSGAQAGNSSGHTAVTVSMFEIYNDSIKDLFANREINSRSVLDIVTDPRDGKLKPRNLSQFYVPNIDICKRLFELGLKNRRGIQKGSTSTSSGSHCFVHINFVKISKDGRKSAVSRFTLADLSSIESTKSAQAKNISMKQKSINNTSILELGRCIHSLRSGKQDMSLLRTNKIARLLFHDFIKNKGMNPQLKFLVNLDSNGDQGTSLQILRYISSSINDDRRTSSRPSSSGSRDSVKRLSVTQRLSSRISSTHVKEKETLEKIKKEKDILTKELKQLQDKLVENEISIRKEISNNFEESIAKLNDEFRQKEISLQNSLEKDCDRKLTDLADEYEQTLCSMRSELDSKSIENQDLLKKIASLRDELKHNKIENESFQSSITKLNETIELKAQKISDLKVSSASLREELDTTTASLNETTKSLNDSKELVTRLQAEITEKKSLLEQREFGSSEIKQDYEKQIRDLRNQVKRLDADVTAGENVIKKLESNLEQKIAEVDEMKTKLSQAEKSIDFNKRHIDILKDKFTASKQKLPASDDNNSATEHPKSSRAPETADPDSLKENISPPKKSKHKSSSKSQKIDDALKLTSFTLFDKLEPQSVDSSVKRKRNILSSPTKASDLLMSSPTKTRKKLRKKEIVNIFDDNELD
ncbi:Kinesin-related motor protein [Komagataella phaffii CBS 7435]|uniref:Kinesin motor domain-containing protein n=2 Tax=Komagataella phaffii TaxID=460519 RepID=C4R8F2_KOMPG|nr:Hypothetical protein PAS_chr4_0617 [Komagataella phaffii GS115]AOA64822.1 GQ67_04991T0 [Komagataella phaffii]CAH2450722.1 Kinesin-related motor protein [Komagataella phaffii CBS 7435]AOA69693.1 GQ68_04972T0 [Komagataella phaffii GS115]CAY71877.1 Hypothetical protein PAS_chr4_0617 [Komagataella phaffii GS115]CCA40522.1 Kinesin-related motor protein [Komagataella phaffii CBS 7435]